MMSRAGVVSASYVWMSFCIGVCAMIPSYNIHTRCNTTIDMKIEKFHLGQIVFDMALPGTTVKIRNTCTIVIETWFSKPNIQYYFSELELPSCENSQLEIEKSTTGDVYTYPRDFGGSKCGVRVSSLLNEVYTVTGSYLKIKLTWSNQAPPTTSFKMIFNSYGTGSCQSTNEHLCDNKRCIMKNITCENYNTCGDQSDCSTDKVSEETIDAINGAIIFFQVAFGVIFVGISCFIGSKFFKDSRLGRCAGGFCECLRDCKSCFVHAGRACMSGIGRGGSTCMSAICRLPGRCRNCLREKCSNCELCRRPEEDTSTPQRPLPPPPEPEQSEHVNRTQIYMSSISYTNEYDDFEDSEEEGASGDNVLDPPPPYTAEFRRNKGKYVPSAPPQEDVEELPPPPHYDEVICQPSKYMKN